MKKIYMLTVIATCYFLLPSICYSKFDPAKKYLIVKNATKKPLKAIVTYRKRRHKSNQRTVVMIQPGKMEKVMYHHNFKGCDVCIGDSCKNINNNIDFDETVMGAFFQACNRSGGQGMNGFRISMSNDINRNKTNFVVGAICNNSSRFKALTATS